MRLRHFIALVLICLTSGIAHAQQRSMRTVGYASYYHNKFHGRRTASGKRYDKNRMTCAHLRFPFGTILRVTNLRTGKEVEVEVTDRGPYSHKYIIDLSLRAAKELGTIGSLTKVQLTPIGEALIPFRLNEVRYMNTDSILTMLNEKPFGEHSYSPTPLDSILRGKIEQTKVKVGKGHGKTRKDRNK